MLIDPFEALIAPLPGTTTANTPAEPVSNPLSLALNKVQFVMGKQVDAAESIVVASVRNVQVGNLKWNVFTQIVAVIYAILALTIAFAREDFLNVREDISRL